MMESLPQPDSHFRPAPGLTGAGERRGPPGPPAGEDALPLGASRGLIGVLVAMAATIGLAMVIAVVFAVAGVDDIGDNKAFTFIATFAGDFALVAAAWGITAGEGRRPTLRMFGLRRFRFWPAIGWIALAFFAYLMLAGVYTELVNPPQDDLPDELGADESTLLAVLTGVFVIGVAPPVEEFFFRGFLFQALRNSWGPALGALGSAVIFAAIHLQPDKFVQLTILGLALAFLFHRTNSLWPCIMLHGFNNILAFAVTV
jgi:membrane protease YdiL (CAAX protease family)